MKAALGLSQLAEFYGRSPSLLQEALQIVGDQLGQEPDPEMQKTLGATFIRLSQEAANNKQYIPIQQAIASVDELREKFPAPAERLRPPIGVLDRLEETLTETTRSPQLSANLIQILTGFPNTH